MEYTLFKPEKGKFYVYEHSIDGEVFFVGYGKNTAPVSLTRSNKYWERVGDNIDKVRVNIAGKFDSEDEALSVAIDLAIAIEMKGELALVPTPWFRSNILLPDIKINRAYISTEPEESENYKEFIEESKRRKLRKSYFSEDEINHLLAIANEEDWGSDYKGVMRLNGLLAHHEMRLIIRHHKEYGHTDRRWYLM